MKNRLAAVFSLAALAGCTSVGIGLTLPIGGLGGVSIGVGSDGRVSGGVSVGTGGVSVGVGGTAQLPPQEPGGRSRSAAASASAPGAATGSAASSAASAASSPRT